MRKKLRLYIWTGYCPDYTAGLAFAIASSEDEARELVSEKYGGEPYEWGDLEVRRLDHRVAREVCGGG